jgi:ribosomal silencing factor RsfS
MKPLKRRCKAEQVLHKSAGAEDLRETSDRSSERTKALKGKAQERWELKDAAKVLVS